MGGDFRNRRLNSSLKRSVNETDRPGVVLDCAYSVVVAGDLRTPCVQEPDGCALSVALEIGRTVDYCGMFRW